MKLNEALLIMRQNIIKFYKQYEVIIGPVIKFILIFAVVRMLGLLTVTPTPLNGAMVTLFIALIGTVLPEKWLILGMVILVPLHMLRANPLMALGAFVFLIILYCLFMRLYPKESLLIIATIVGFNLGFEMLIPLLAGLFGSYISIIAIMIGVFIWFVTPEVATLLATNGLGKNEIIETYNQLSGINIQGILANKEMLCTLVIFFVVFTIVYIVHNLPVDYAHYVAIGVGTVMNLAGFGMAILFLKIDVNIGQVVFLSLGFAVVATVVQFFSRVLDYQRAEIVNFEDDENYYYVRVVPKIYLTTAHKKVKRVYNTEGGRNEMLNRIMERDDSTSM